MVKLSISGRDQEVWIWREIASVLVPIAVLSVLFFTMWEQGQNFGEREGMQYSYFLTLALTGTGICLIIFHTINFFEKLFFVTKIFNIKIALISGLLLGVAPGLFYLVSVVRLSEPSPFLVLPFGIIIILLLSFSVRFPLIKRVLYEICLRILFPIAIFILFLGIAVDRVDQFAVLFYTSLAYFFARPFVDHIVWTRPAVAPFEVNDMGSKMWNNQKSVTLSQLCVLLFAAATLAVVLGAPWVVGWLVDFSRANLQGKEKFFYATIYLGALPAFTLLYSLLLLLKRIEANEMFTPENVLYLRRISWSCHAGALVTLISSGYYFPWIAVTIAAGFMGLIVRVIKNLVALGVALQQDADYTV